MLFIKTTHTFSVFRLPDWRFSTAAAVFLSCFFLSGGVLAQSPEEASGLPFEGKGFPARIEAIRQADVMAAVEGTINQINFDAGQTVAPGDVLITLDARHYQLAVRNAEANVRRAEKILEAAQGELDRAEQLFEKGTASTVRVLKSRVSIALAEAVLDEARARLEAEQINLERTVLRAPIGGIIGRQYIEIGGLVSPGFSTSLAHIVQMDPIMVAYKIPYVQRIRELGIKGLTDLEDLLKRVRLTIKISDEWIYQHKAIPQHGSAGVDPETGEITIWAKVPNPDHLLRPGMKVRVFSNLGPGDLNR